MPKPAAPAAPAAPWQNAITRYAQEAPDQLLSHPANPKIHPKGQRDALSGALDRVGWIAPVLVNERTQHVLDGHARIGLAISRGEPTVPVLYVDVAEDDEPFVLATFDPLAAMAVFDKDMLEQVLGEISTDNDALQGMLDDLARSAGIGLEGEGAPPEGEGADAEAAAGTEARVTLAERFVVPPFSVLDARQGYWQDRKRAWLALGIQSELGRGDNNPHSTAWLSRGAGGYQDAPGSVRGKAKAITWQASLDAIQGESGRTGTSIFDPVLCEVIYRWFCPPSGRVLDPFAGGSVRGIVAAQLGRPYVGVDLRPEQVAANQAQAQAICATAGEAAPTWYTGDSSALPEVVGDSRRYDLVFTCPPYGDLEVYSDDPRDLSTMDYAAFVASYRQIIAHSIGLLQDDRFAAIVVGDFRDPRGLYRNFVAETIDAFQAAGARLYNEAVLVTAIGSLPIRVGRQFSVGRKLGKLHQNCLVFVKGDPKRACEACGPVEVSVPDEADDSDEPGIPAGAEADGMGAEPWSGATDTEYD